jgi:hypothetical protein
MIRYTSKPVISPYKKGRVFDTIEDHCYGLKVSLMLFLKNLFKKVMWET